MNCNCKWTESIIGIVIIVFAWWNLGGNVSQWIITIAAALLILHALKCTNCGVPRPKSSPRKRR